jgi:OH-DDVA meta-cleavage compound hydrolase
LVIDVHAHVTAPDSLYAWKAGLLSHRGAHGRGDPMISDDEMRAVLNAPTFGTSSHLEQLAQTGIDMQIISPRPYQSMHSERPSRLVHWYTEAVNNVIAQQCRLYPDTFAGMCGLPSAWGTEPKDWTAELERCVRDQQMVGCLLNTDPSEGLATSDIPSLGDRWWYPLFEKLCELDVPAYVHGGGCRSSRHTYSVNFILEETIAIMSLATSSVFKDFPSLKIVVSHGGGAVPYQYGRFRTNSIRRGPEPLRDSLRRLWFDTVLYSSDAMELLIKTVGADRCLFGTERPGVGTVKDPDTGRWLDDLRPVVESMSFLSADDKHAILEGNAHTVFGIASKG